MDEHETENDQDYPDVQHRLQAFAAAPLRPGLAGATLERARSGGRRKIGGGRLKLMSAAAVVGFAAAGVGLAAADVLPAPVQDAAHTTLASVGLHVPPGHNRYNDPTVCPGGPYANHGAYVRSHKSDPNAGQSPCGKPVQAVGPSGALKGGETPADDSGESGATGHGPPPWAHGKGKSKDKPDDQGGASTAPGKTTKPEKPSSTTTTPRSTGSTSPSSASTTSTSPSTASTTSTTLQS